MKVKTNIVSDEGDPFMGPGPLRLLERIKKYKSINKAAKDMNLSYVKALNMLDRLEKAFNGDFLIRKRGGNNRGGTELTPLAEEFIRDYKMIEARINELAAREFVSMKKKYEEEK